jgi:hypothetical protein
MNGGEEECGNSTCAVENNSDHLLGTVGKNEARSMRAVKDGVPAPYGESEESKWAS